MKDYPSLYASLEPATHANGRRGSVVRCTATLRPLGIVWWVNPGGTTIVWEWQVGDRHGARVTERAAVQALRDVANATAGRMAIQPRLDLDETPRPVVGLGPRVVRRVEPTAAAPVRRAPEPAPSPRPVIVWDDGAPTFDVTAAIAAGLKRRQ